MSGSPSWGACCLASGLAVLQAALTGSNPLAPPMLLGVVVADKAVPEDDGVDLARQRSGPTTSRCGVHQAFPRVAVDDGEKPEATIRPTGCSKTAKSPQALADGL